MMAKAFKIERRGRKAKPGKRYPSGDLVQEYRLVEGQGYVYVIERGTAVKIGFSENPRRRSTGMQSGSPKEIRLLYSHAMPLETAREVERSLHRVLRKTAFHIRGEWYSLKPNNAISLIRAAADHLQGASRG